MEVQFRKEVPKGYGTLFTSWWWQWQIVYRLAETKRGDWQIVHTMVLTPTSWWWSNRIIMSSSWCMRKMMSLLIIISLPPSIPSQRYVGGGDIRNALHWMISSPSFQILKTNPLKNQPSSTSSSVGGDPWLQTDWTLRLENAPKPSTNSSKLVWPKR